MLLAEVQRTMNTLRKTAICREPLAIVENRNGKLWTLPKGEERICNTLKMFLWHAGGKFIGIFF